MCLRGVRHLDQFIRLWSFFKHMWRLSAAKNFASFTALHQLPFQGSNSHMSKITGTSSRASDQGAPAASWTVTLLMHRSVFVSLVSWFNGIRLDTPLQGALSLGFAQNPLRHGAFWPNQALCAALLHPHFSQLPPSPAHRWHVVCKPRTHACLSKRFTLLKVSASTQLRLSGGCSPAWHFAG